MKDYLRFAQLVEKAAVGKCISDWLHVWQSVYQGSKDTKMLPSSYNLIFHP